ncbi:hypothetical protein LCGC14_2999250 [marine sediment metagenome]|uniref:Uncharacterized protein n=1 Tax=marine sediment metagenome TaxID=412755 RepID=A0A0F8XP54_9ZZZZ
MIRLLLLMLWIPIFTALAGLLALGVGGPVFLSRLPCQPDLAKTKRLPIEIKVLQFPGVSNVVLWRPATIQGRARLGAFWRGSSYNTCGKLIPKALYQPKC